MKKLFAIAAMAAMLFACGEEKPAPKPNPGPDPDEPVFESKITVDGDFADWDALDASKVSVAELPALPVKYDALTKVKVYADEMYLNVYFEFDDVAIADRAWTPFHCYINADGNETTGGGDALWAPYCAEWMLEGIIFVEGEFNSYDPALFPWDEASATADGVEYGWYWKVEGAAGDETDNWGALIGENNGLASGAGNGNAYEFQVVREMIPGEWADTFTIGFDIQQNWSTAGALPILTATDENPDGATTMMSVTIDK
jgi:hypothetical protein